MTAYLLEPLLPWDILPEERNRSRTISTIVMVICLAITLIVPFLPVPVVERSQQETLPPRLAKLVMQQKVIKTPPPPAPKEEKPEEKKEVKKEEKKPEKKPEPIKKEPEKRPEIKKPFQEAKQKAREVAKKHIAVFDSLADLRDVSVPVIKPKNLSSNSGQQTAKIERSMITSAATASSGGVATAKASTGGGGSGALAVVNTTKVQSKLTEVQKAQQQRETATKNKITQRSTEDIQFVIDQNKGAINGIYKRFLREDAGLEGTVVFRLVIAPNGSVTKCEVVSSDLDNEEMERKLVARIRLINFGAGNVGVWNNTYPISFIPS